MAKAVFADQSIAVKNLGGAPAVDRYGVRISALVSSFMCAIVSFSTRVRPTGWSASASPHVRLCDEDRVGRRC